MKKELAERWLSSGIVKSKKILDAFLKTPRELFVPEGYEKEAYNDYPLPIPKGQTISQPSTIMIMIEALEPKRNQKVLEVGTGSGYNAALLSRLVRKVITTEIVPELCDFAGKNMEKAGIKNVLIVHADGSKGYEKEKPYDRIIVTAAAPAILESWTGQLREGGIIVAPVGEFMSQVMIKARKVKGKIIKEEIGYFAFVPLKGKYGHKKWV